MAKRNKILLIITLLLYGVFIIPGWNMQIKALGALLIIQLLWIGRVFPLAFSSLLFILIVAFHFLTYDEALSYFGSSLVWLLFSTFILAHAFIKTGLANRISLSILSLAKGSGRLLVFVSFILEFVLTILIPSNIGKGQLISSILNDLIQNLRELHHAKNVGKSLFIGIAYVSALSAAFVPTGASSTIYAFGMFSGISHQMNYLTWILSIGVPICVFVFFLWFIFLYRFPIEQIDVRLIRQLIQAKKQKLGPWKREEIRMALIISVTICLWLTQPLHHQPISLIALLGAILATFPSIGVMKWSEVKTAVEWDMMIFFASTLMLSNVLVETGTLNTLASFFINNSHALSSSHIVVGFIILTALVRVVFVNVLGYLTIILPLALAVGEQLQVSPLVLAMGVYLAAVPGFLLITQSPVHLISYSYNHFQTGDLLKVGFVSMAVWVAVIIISMFLYWNFIL